MFKYFNNLYSQCLIFTIVWQLLLCILYLNNLITYNPLIEFSDIIPNLFFIYFLTLLFSSPLFSFFLLLLIYVLGGLLYFFTKQNFTLVQLINLPELIIIYNPYSYFLIIFLSIFIYLLFKFSIRQNFIAQKKTIRIIQIGLCVFFIFLVSVSTQLYFPKISKHNTESFNKFATWKHGGQLYSLIYHYAERRNMILKLNGISGGITPLLNFESVPKSKIKIMVLLESFVPMWDMEPDKYQSFLQDLDFKSIRLETPAYGGYSAKSEFEILCGLPELQVLGDMTFNFLGKNDTNFCLPSLLSKFKYKTISITGTDSHFHNAKNAYPSLGFKNIISKKDLITDDFDGIHPSDESIFNRAYNEILKNKNNNVFLYIFTAAGHSPYHLNQIKRPRLSENIYYDRVSYTEKELKKFLKKLELLNIQTSVIVASDHATESSKLKGNNKLLNVWYKLDDPNNFLDCSQYYHIPKFFTGQKCNKIKKSKNEIFGRGKNLPSYERDKLLSLKLIKKSQQ